MNRNDEYIESQIIDKLNKLEYKKDPTHLYENESSYIKYSLDEYEEADENIIFLYSSNNIEIYYSKENSWFDKIEIDYFINEFK